MSDVTYGTAPLDGPVTRDDLERALRSLHLGDLDLRDLVLRLAAHVTALTEELDRRRVTADEASIASAVAAATPVILERIRASDARDTPRVWLEGASENKYEVASPDIPCDELIPLCGARCCKMQFPLSTADLDEGVIRWDYGQPYQIRQRASDGFCVHNDPATHGCTVHTQRPATCRRYDCRNDARVWIDYDKRIPAPLDHASDAASTSIDLVERIRQRALAEVVEANAITRTYADDEPRSGPLPSPRPPRVTR